MPPTDGKIRFLSEHIEQLRAIVADMPRPAESMGSYLAKVRERAYAVTDADVYVSVVPFSKDVNVGPDKFNETWLRWDLWDAANGSCSNSSYTTQSTCTSHSKIWTPASHSTWNGCVTDRDQNFDTKNDAPVDRKSVV